MALPEMEHARCGMGAGAVGNKLIVCGGYGRGECLDSVEQFDPVAFVWKRLPDMPTQRFVFASSLPLTSTKLPSHIVRVCVTMFFLLTHASQFSKFFSPPSP